MLKLHLDTFRVPKVGARPDECDDAGYPDEAERALDSETFSLALCDGATESYLSGRWAQTLSRVLATPPRLPLRRRIENARAVWASELLEYVRQRSESGRPIQWYEEPVMDRGAESTLIVGRISKRARNGESRTYLFEAIGDTNLFVVRDGQLIKKFPLTQHSEFGSTPNLISSRMGEPIRPAERVQGTWRSGDQFLLATDALAAWLLRQLECGDDPWPKIQELGAHDTRSFTDWIDELRRDRGLRNDDTTLMRLDMID